jgi:D-threo-aldose 1-dehydrogenase
VKQVQLAPGGRYTTQLGFGCAYVTRSSSSLLDAAYDAGIRHFDVARSYDHGRAEGTLRRHLERWAEVTVTTKYGLKPAYRNGVDHAVRKGARVAAAKLGLRIPHWLAGQAVKAAFTCDDLMRSVQTSQAALGRNRIDLLLLHEASADDLADARLFEGLQELRAKGTIGNFGVGGPAVRLPRLLAERPHWCPVLQYDWSPIAPAPAHPDSRPIFYRSFAPAAQEIAKRLERDPALVRVWSDETGIDLAAPRMLSSLMLRAALTSRPDALVLFSTSKPENIAHAVVAANDSGLDRPAKRLVELATA